MQSLLSFFGLSPVSQLFKYLLERLLGSYFIQPEKAAFSFKNPIFFNHLALNPSKINQTILKNGLFTLKSGCVKNFHLKVPWSDLLTESIEASLDEMEIFLMKSIEKRENTDENSKNTEENEEKSLDFSKNSSVFKKIVEKIIRNLKLELKTIRIFLEIDPGFIIILEFSGLFFNFLSNLDYSLKIKTLIVSNSKPMKIVNKVLFSNDLIAIVNKEALRFSISFKTLIIDMDLDLINDFMAIQKKNYWKSSEKFLEKTENFFRSQFSNKSNEINRLFPEEIANFAEDENLKSIIAEIFQSLPDLQDKNEAFSNEKASFSNEKGDKTVVFEIIGNEIKIALLEEFMGNNDKGFSMEIRGIRLEVAEKTIIGKIEEIVIFDDLEENSEKKHKCRRNIAKIQGKNNNFAGRFEKNRNNNSKEITKIYLNPIKLRLSQETLEKIKAFNEKISGFNEENEEKPMKFPGFSLEIPSIEVLFEVSPPKTSKLLCDYCEKKPLLYIFQLRTNTFLMNSSTKNSSLSLKIPNLEVFMQNPSNNQHFLSSFRGFELEIGSNNGKKPVFTEKIANFLLKLKLSEAKVFIDLTILYEFVVFLKNSPQDFSQDEIFSENNASFQENHEFSHISTAENPFFYEFQLETLEILTFLSENPSFLNINQNSDLESSLWNRFSNINLCFSNNFNETLINSVDFSLFFNKWTFSVNPLKISLDFLENAVFTEELLFLETKNIEKADFRLEIELQRNNSMRKAPVFDEKVDFSAGLQSVKNSIFSEIIPEEEIQDFSIKSLKLNIDGMNIKLGMLILPVFQRILKKIREISEVFEEKQGNYEKKQEFDLDILINRVDIDIFPIKIDKNLEFLSSRSLILIRKVQIQRKEGDFSGKIEELRGFFAYFTNKISLPQAKIQEFVEFRNSDEIPAIFKPIFELQSLFFSKKKLEICDFFLSFCKDTPIFLKKHIEFLIIELFDKYQRLFSRKTLINQEKKLEFSNFETLGKSLDHSDSFEKCEKILENSIKDLDFQIVFNAIILYLYDGIDFPLISALDFEISASFPPKVPKFSLNYSHFELFNEEKRKEWRIPEGIEINRVFSRYLQVNFKALELCLLKEKFDISLGDLKLFEKLDYKKPLRQKAMGRVSKEYPILEFSISFENATNSIETIFLKFKPMFFTIKMDLLDFLIKFITANIDLFQDDIKDPLNPQESTKITESQQERYGKFYIAPMNEINEPMRSKGESETSQIEDMKYSEGLTKITDSINEKNMEFSQHINKENKRKGIKIKRFVSEGFKLVINFEPNYQNLAYVFQDPKQLMNIGAIQGLEIWLKSIVLDDWEIENIAKFCLEVWSFDIRSNQKLEILKKMPYIDNLVNVFTGISRKISYLFSKTN